MARLLLSAACLLFFVPGTPHRIPTMCHSYSFARGCTLSEYVVNIACAEHLWNLSIVVSRGDSDPCSLTVRGKSWSYVAHVVVDYNMLHSRLVHAGTVSYEFSTEYASPHGCRKCLTGWNRRSGRLKQGSMVATEYAVMYVLDLVFAMYCLFAMAMMCRAAMPAYSSRTESNVFPPSRSTHVGGGCGAHLFLAHDTVVSSLDNRH
ncbi:hypothetical protein IW261DRAFT_1427110 [Armillaria novae-zelandiae]|uniref:Uncharacterized protein n=1 Tax=Armillaria novae-zelandiae TaxID=153914 RepID=A0AA39NHH0_9AGAR|nr:hypothetical protein IW261DRAFT_1427110 [Armillaria novae-zelandiae]